jgi:hypothetical protein
MQAGQPNLTGGNKFDKAKTPGLEDYDYGRRPQSSTKLVAAPISA